MINSMSLDRLSFTLIFSLAFHLAFLFGIGFQATSPPTNTSLINLDITLVHQQTEEAPDKADFLAQANNIGGGERTEKTPEPVPEQLLEEILENQPPPEIAEPMMPKPTITEQQAISKPPASADKLITQTEAERQVVELKNIAEEPIKDEMEPTIEPQLTAAELVDMAHTEMARLEAKYDATAEALSKTPKKRRITSSTKEYVAAAYLDGWLKKVERIGNINYPQEAKRKEISGNLILAVDINPDGSVPADGINFIRKSRHEMLNDAAVRIVRLGAPYSVVPENVLKDNDMITIIRTWKFETDLGLSSQK